MFFRTLIVVFLLGGFGSASAVTLQTVRDQSQTRAPGALDAARQLVKANPASLEATLELAIAERRYGTGEAAFAAAEAAVAIDPSSVAAHLELAAAIGQRVNEVNVLRKLGMASDALEVLQTAVELGPDQVAPRRALMGFYLAAPGLAGGSRSKAQQQSELIAKIDAAAGHAARARIHSHDGDNVAALRSYVSALKLKPDEPEYRLNVGIYLQSVKNWNAAFEHFIAWTDEQPEATAAWYQLGRTAVLSGQRSDVGIAALQRFLALPEDVRDPQPADTWFRLGQAYEQAGAYAESRKALGQALRLNPEHTAAVDVLAKLPAD